MAETTQYILDTNIYIAAYRNYYAFDLVESFWKHLVDGAKSGRIVSIDKVKAELEHEIDPLCEWATKECHQAFTSTDRPDALNIYADIMKWVNGMNFKPAAKAEFARGADGWVIAYAKAAGHTVVTHEAYRPDAIRTVPMPNICKQFGVEYVDTFVMLREIGLKIG